MKKRLSAILFVLLLVISFSCQKPLNDAAEELALKAASDTDIESVTDWVTSCFGAADAGDVEGYLSFWAEDIIWMPPNAPIIQGTAPMREILEPYFGQITTRREISINEIKVADNFAFARVDSKETYTSKTEEGQPVEASYKTIVLLQRTPDGKWLGTHYIWNSNDPPPSSKDDQ